MARLRALAASAALACAGFALGGCTAVFGWSDLQGGTREGAPSSASSGSSSSSGSGSSASGSGSSSSSGAQTTCGGARCGSGQVCCDSYVSGRLSCSTGCSDGVAYACLNPADCGGGKVCCELTGGGSRCSASCDAIERVVCTPGAAKPCAGAGERCFFADPIFVCD